jgi:predicted nuclease of predicted toxin-antitoxin system
LTLPLLIDEDSQAKILVNLLLQAGHDVLTVNEAGLSGQPDRAVFQYACFQGRLVLTRNYDDFQSLHQKNLIHPGILVIYGDANYAKDMSFKDIVRAIANLETANFSLADRFIALNH